MAHDQAIGEGHVEQHRALTLERVDVQVIELPTEDAVESDGTIEWSSTTMVLVECRAGGVSGLGYTYAHASAAQLIETMLADAIAGVPVMATGIAWSKMVRAVRNQGLSGISAMAISAVDNALWDLKARVLGLPLAHLLGQTRELVPVYASGGFTSSGPGRLERELEGYRQHGFTRVKIKVGRVPSLDGERVRTARSVLGPETELMVDANGAYARKQALDMAQTFARYEVAWFEEPVPSDDLAGLRVLRDRAPAEMSIAAGEYGYDAAYFRRMLEAGAVDVLQADATRCLGVTGFLQASALAASHGLKLSSHCAPTLHRQLGAVAPSFAHLEYFRDHARMESLLFEGAPEPRDSFLSIDPHRPGFGVELRREEARRHVH